MKKIIRGGTVVTMDESFHIFETGTVVLEGDRIIAVQEGVWRGQAGSGEEIIDAEGFVVIPGLVNGHIHARPARALGDGLTLREWHDKYPDNLVRGMTGEDAKQGALLACAEMMRTGTTTLMAMPNMPADFGRGAEEAGIRAIVASHAADMPHLMDSCDTLEDNIATVKAQGDRYKQARVKYCFGFEHPLAATDDMVREIRKLADTYRVPITTHVAEHKGEVDSHIERHGVDPITRYEKLGLLGPDFHIAHGNWLTPENIGVIAKHGCSVIHNPASNMKLGTGIAPLQALIDAGVRVGLGTDGMLSGYTMNMFEVLKATAWLQRIHNLNPELLPAREVMYLATRGGAAAIGLEEDIGSLVPGKKADVAMLDFRKPHLTPRIKGLHDNLYALLVFCASGFETTNVFVDGQAVLREGILTTINEKELLAWFDQEVGRITACFPA
jgi:5-methylthioadenosine/S-adenosylhomocysteine deaminase